MEAAAELSPLWIAPKESWPSVSIQGRADNRSSPALPAHASIEQALGIPGHLAEGLTLLLPHRSCIPIIPHQVAWSLASSSICIVQPRLITEL